MAKLTKFLLVLIFLTSCDCLQIVSGTVVDKQTGKPLPGVKVYNKRRTEIKTITDSVGHFRLSAISGGFRCPPMKIVAEIENYQPTEVSIPTGSQRTIPIQSKNQSTHNRVIDLMQGFWYHSEDSLASVFVNKLNWTFNYKGSSHNVEDDYTILITDKLPAFVKETEVADFLILSNKTDMLQYEIMGVTDSTLSLMYFPAGKIHLYKRYK